MGLVSRANGSKVNKYPVNFKPIPKAKFKTRQTNGAPMSKEEMHPKAQPDQETKLTTAQCSGGFLRTKSLKFRMILSLRNSQLSITASLTTLP